MNNDALAPESLKVIEGYLHLKIGGAVASVPYFNNKTVKARFSDRAHIGKGSPEDIMDELKTVLSKHHIVTSSLADESLKKILVDENLGLDCSAFVYHVLSEESRVRKLGALNKRITFLKIRGAVAKMWSYLRPVENCDVATFASDTNSRIISVADAKPGDLITMMAVQDDGNKSERNHILLIHEVERADNSVKSIHYSHAVQYPEDGLYGSGIRQGVIEVTDASKPITEQNWTEDSRTNSASGIYVRAKNSRTELRRLKWF